MKHPILLNIKEQFPKAVEKEGAPANCQYRIAYTDNRYWQNDTFRIVEQDYDAKDAYLSLIEIKAEAAFSFIISTTASDLLWLYLLKGAIKIKQHPSGMEPNGFLDSLQEDEYALLYSPPRQYKITVERGLHVLFLFVVNSTWLQRHPIVEPTHYQKLIGFLQHKKDNRSSTKVLTIHEEIRREILHLLTMSNFGEMQMDVKVYASIVNLVLISREDLKKNGIPVGKDIQEILVQIRHYYEKQISLGQAPPIAEVAEYFEISLQQLRLAYKAVYGHNLQSYITKRRMEMAADLLLNTNNLVSIIAYDTGYHLKVFQKQFKSYYGISPSEFRHLYKK